MQTINNPTVVVDAPPPPATADRFVNVANGNHARDWHPKEHQSIEITRAELNAIAKDARDNNVRTIAFGGVRFSCVQFTPGMFGKKLEAFLATHSRLSDKQLTALGDGNSIRMLVARTGSGAETAAVLARIVDAHVLRTLQCDVEDEQLLVAALRSPVMTALTLGYMSAPVDDDIDSLVRAHPRQVGWPRVLKVRFERHTLLVYADGRYEFAENSSSK
jgi:hypothetical protein